MCYVTLVISHNHNATITFYYATITCRISLGDGNPAVTATQVVTYDGVVVHISLQEWSALLYL